MQQTTDDAKGTVMFWHTYFMDYKCSTQPKASVFLKITTNYILWGLKFSLRPQQYCICLTGEAPYAAFVFFSSKFYSTNIIVKHADSKFFLIYIYLYIYIIMYMAVYPRQSSSSIVYHTLYCALWDCYLMVILCLWYHPVRWRWLDLGKAYLYIKHMINFLAACSSHQTIKGLIRGKARRNICFYNFLFSFF